MGSSGNSSHGRRRVRPTPWPRRAHMTSARPRHQRWLREREPFEDLAALEAYPGAAVVEDLAEDAGRAATLRVLARYAVIRIFELCAAGRLSGPKLRTEQRVAAGHLALLPAHDWERHALEKLSAACTEELSPAALDLARVCAEAAGKRGQRLGAFSFYRATCEVAVQRGWWDDAAAGAHGIRRLAQAQAALRSARIWRWRARVFEARHARHLLLLQLQQEQEQTATADAPAQE
jgi:hypothetical protein